MLIKYTPKYTSRPKNIATEIGILKIQLNLFSNLHLQVGMDHFATSSFMSKVVTDE
jgi:hypothetical protein